MEQMHIRNQIPDRPSVRRGVKKMWDEFHGMLIFMVVSAIALVVGVVLILRQLIYTAFWGDSVGAGFALAAISLFILFTVLTRSFRRFLRERREKDELTTRNR